MLCIIQTLTERATAPYLAPPAQKVATGTSTNSSESKSNIKKEKGFLFSFTDGF